jgi:hypothetical protein
LLLITRNYHSLVDQRRMTRICKDQEYKICISFVIHKSSFQSVHSCLFKAGQIQVIESIHCTRL